MTGTVGVVDGGVVDGGVVDGGVVDGGALRRVCCLVPALLQVTVENVIRVLTGKTNDLSLL